MNTPPAGALQLIPDHPTGVAAAGVGRANCAGTRQCVLPGTVIQAIKVCLKAIINKLCTPVKKRERFV